MRHVHNALPHVNLIPQTRALLIAAGKPYVIENVEGAREWLIDPIMLCGTMFGLGARGQRTAASPLVRDELADHGATLPA